VSYARALAELLPHGPGMVLLDRMLGVGPDWGEAEVTIRRDSRFSDGTAGVPGYVGIEYMAQTLAAFAGAQRLERGQPVQIALLLGTRRYESQVGWFAPGWTLTARVTQLLHTADGVSAFACELAHGATRVAHAEIKAYQPDDIEPYLTRLEHERDHGPRGQA
jgi:predicted hotdog family 3-hydroxylacyl-ACP dehydratase